MDANRNELAQSLMKAAQADPWIAGAIVKLARRGGFDAKTEAMRTVGFDFLTDDLKEWKVVATAANFLADEGVTVASLCLALS